MKLEFEERLGSTDGRPYYLVTDTDNKHELGRVWWSGEPPYNIAVNRWYPSANLCRMAGISDRVRTIGALRMLLRIKLEGKQSLNAQRTRRKLDLDERKPDERYTVTFRRTGSTRVKHMWQEVILEGKAIMVIFSHDEWQTCEIVSVLPEMLSIFEPFREKTYPMSEFVPEVCRVYHAHLNKRTYVPKPDRKAQRPGRKLAL